MTLVGVKSDGSSGRSEKFYLKHSNIRVKLSTMISLQRNGWPLDGFGTEPDIVVDANRDQVFHKSDGQFAKALEVVKGSTN